MRRNILIIISFLTLLVASGCTNLDEKWYSEVTPDTYFIVVPNPAVLRDAGR